MEKWHKLAKDGNELERLRARQFKELAENDMLLERIDNEIVSLVLDRVEVYNLGELKFYFMDISEIIKYIIKI